MEFSVLMSLYYKETSSNLDVCIESIYNQSVKPSEIVLVFDGPVSAELENIVSKWSNYLNIIVHRLDYNVGLGIALNEGLKKCTHEVIARMDTDDICLPDRFEKQLDAFVKNDCLTVCGSSILEVEPSSLKIISERRVPLSHKEILRCLPRKNPFNHMTVMYKKSAVLSAGGYIDHPWMEDWSLWVRLLSKGYNGMNLNENLVKARTGSAMLMRRSGFRYIKSEWKMFQLLLRYGQVSILKGFLIFIFRSTPRLFPKFLLQKVYYASR